jgi:Mg-chelatase subunit ChlD
MRAILKNERGSVLAMVALSTVVICGMAGLAIDGARGYVTRAELSRAVDAAALSGAAALRQGQSQAEQRIRSLAAANGVSPTLDPNTTLDIEFGMNEEGENTVMVSATRRIPTFFMRVMGREHLDVASVAEATVPPLDLVLVLDHSGSLFRNNAHDDLQRAAKDFVDHFDDSIDQMGLVTFNWRGSNRFMIDAPFTTTIKSRINAMVFDNTGDTNIAEGLRRAKEQLDTGPIRDRSVKVVVLFTDGRPTAFREMIGGRDRILAIYTTPCCIQGYWNNPDALPVDPPKPSVNGCRNASSCQGYTDPTARQKAKDWTAVRANEIREENVYLFVIGLGDPDTEDELEVPDDDFMRMLANQDGNTDPDQLQGAYYFAPSAAELGDVFEAVAEDILVRLTQ